MARNKLIQFRRDTAVTWTSVNPLLESGETGFETDTKLMKIGDGVSLWTALPYFKDLSGYSLTSHNHTGVYEPVDTTLVRAPLGVLPVLDGSNLTGIVSGVSSVSGTAPVVSSGGATPVISMAAATALVNGYMTSTYASKLDGVETSANNYVLPASVVHDTESGALHATDALRVSGTTLSLYKGDGTFESVDTQDTVYTHPTTDGNLHVPATSTTNSGKVLTAGATAGSISWVTPSSGVTDHTLLTNIGTRTHAQLESDISAKAPIASPVFTGNVTGLGVSTGTSFNAITGLASVAPVAPAVTAVVGTSTLTARQDHAHPTNFTATATDIKMDGVQAVGALTTFPRADHVHPSDTSKLALVGGTMTGAITAIRETRVAMAANDIALNAGNVFTKTISIATTLTVSSVLATGNSNGFILELTNGGAAATTWFSGVKWAGGTAPTLTAAGVDILGFYSHDGGTTWRGLVMAKDSK